MLADLEALWQISEARLVGNSLLGSASQRLGRKDADEFHFFVSVIELMNMLKEKYCAHGVRWQLTTQLSDPARGTLGLQP